jgi:hypothetical protein
MTKPKGSHGGKREGSGAKPKKPEIHPAVVANNGKIPDQPDMVKLLVDIALGIVEANAQQVRAAIEAAKYQQGLAGPEAGKKEQKQKAAEEVAQRFQSAPVPMSVIQGGRK